MLEITQQRKRDLQWNPPQYERNGMKDIRKNSNISVFLTIYERNNAVKKFAIIIKPLFKP